MESTMETIEEHLRGIMECAKSRRHVITMEPDQGSGAEEDPDDAAENDGSEQNPVEKSTSFTVDIEKANDEEQTVTGVVLQPEVVDGQGDIMSVDVIKDTAYRFLANFNRKTKLGLQHSSFPKGKLALVESYLAPIDFVLGSKTVKQGSWIMTVKVLDPKLWQKVKDGRITGFSIGGRAKVIAAEAA